jgi:hypothetical protein
MGEGMKKPSEYIEVLDEFLANGMKGVKFEKATREDVAALTMAIYLRGNPLEIRTKGKDVYLVRKSA